VTIRERASLRGRAADRCAAQFESLDDGSCRAIHRGDPTEIELEPQRFPGQRISTGVFQATHVVGRQPAVEDDPRITSAANGSNAGHDA